MDSTKISDEIASGRLKLRDDPERSFIIRVGRPRPFEGRSGYYCPFQIEGMDLPVRFGAGEDAIQALEIALRNLKAELLYLNAEVFAGKLSWSNGDDIKP